MCTHEINIRIRVMSTFITPESFLMYFFFLSLISFFTALPLPFDPIPKKSLIYFWLLKIHLFF